MDLEALVGLGVSNTATLHGVGGVTFVPQPPGAPQDKPEKKVTPPLRHVTIGIRHSFKNIYHRSAHVWRHGSARDGHADDDAQTVRVCDSSGSIMPVQGASDRATASFRAAPQEERNPADVFDSEES